MEQILLDRPTKSPGKLVFNTRYRFACAMLERLELQPDDHLLDPSAGSGALVAPLFSGRFPMPEMTVLLDIDPRCCGYMQQRWLGRQPEPEIVCGDFLDMRGDYKPTAIVMVSPIGMRQDAVHIRHAYRVLRPAGRMVAFCSASSLMADDSQGLAFRLWLDHVEAEVQAVPEGSFDDPSVHGFLVHIVK
jgi:hypothetical protein